jgi:hypothetical protein
MTISDLTLDDLRIHAATLSLDLSDGRVAVGHIALHRPRAVEKRGTGEANIILHHAAAARQRAAASC